MQQAAWGTDPHPSAVACSMITRGASADAFNKWEAGQRLAKKLLIKLYNAAKSADQVLLPAFRSHVCCLRITN